MTKQFSSTFSYLVFGWSALYEFFPTKNFQQKKAKKQRDEFFLSSRRFGAKRNEQFWADHEGQSFVFTFLTF
jgi:hypothetical protein